MASPALSACFLVDYLETDAEFRSKILWSEDFISVLLLSFTLEKKKIASLLKMPFLDVESPSNPYSRKVNGLSCSLIIFVFYFISVFFPKVKNL